MPTRRNFTDKFKTPVALEALRGDKTLQEIASKHKIRSTQVATWNPQAISGLVGVFFDKTKNADNNGAEIKVLHAKIGKSCG